MAKEYYDLILHYISQDASVLTAFLIALLLVGGYAFIIRLKRNWLTYLYMVVMLFIYAAANLIVMGVTL